MHSTTPRGNLSDHLCIYLHTASPFPRPLLRMCLPVPPGPSSFLSPHLVWAGTLSPAHVAYITDAAPHLKEAIHPSHPTYKALRKISSFVLQGALNILSARHAAITRQTYHRRRLYRQEDDTVYRRNTYRSPPRGKRNSPPSLAGYLRPSPLPPVRPHSHLSSPIIPPPPHYCTPPPNTLHSPSPLSFSPSPHPSFSPTRRPEPSPRPPKPTAPQLTQRSLNEYFKSSPNSAPTTPTVTLSLHSQRTLGTRASLQNSDIALFKKALQDPTCQSLSSCLVRPIAPDALHHLVSTGARGWLCDLTITRISNIANDQLHPSDLSYYCVDGTFFS